MTKALNMAERGDWLNIDKGMLNKLMEVVDKADAVKDI